MDYKELSRITDSFQKVNDSVEERYYYYDGFEGFLEKNLTFDELVSMVKDNLNEEGDIYEDVEKNPQAIWDIEWDLLGGDFERIHYGLMEDFEEDSEFYGFEESEDSSSSGYEMPPDPLMDKYIEDVKGSKDSELNSLNIQRINPRSAHVLGISKDVYPSLKEKLRQLGWDHDMSLGISLEGDTVEIYDYSN